MCAQEAIQAMDEITADKAAGDANDGQPGAAVGLSAAAAKRITVMLENEPDGSFSASP